jgi:hypothetical protein
MMRVPAPVIDVVSCGHLSMLGIQKSKDRPVPSLRGVVGGGQIEICALADGYAETVITARDVQRDVKRTEMEDKHNRECF